VTILLHITFRLNPNWNSIDLASRILIEFHFYISDDKTHDNLFVQHCFSLHWNFLSVQGFPSPLEHIVFNDGCATQFKCAKSLFYVVRYPSITKTEEMPLGCQMQWNRAWKRSLGWCKCHNQASPQERASEAERFEVAQRP
jgi:hypothetical protein